MVVGKVLSRGGHCDTGTYGGNVTRGGRGGGRGRGAGEGRGCVCVCVCVWGGVADGKPGEQTLALLSF